MFAATVWVVTQITTTSTVTIQLQNENFTSNLTISYRPAYTLEISQWTPSQHKEARELKKLSVVAHYRDNTGYLFLSACWVLSAFLPFVKRIFPCSFGNNRMHVYMVLPLKCMDWGTWVLVIATQMDNSGTFSMSGILVLIVLLETLEHTHIMSGMFTTICNPEVSVNKWIVTITCTPLSLYCYKLLLIVKGNLVNLIKTVSIEVIVCVHVHYISCLRCKQMYWIIQIRMIAMKHPILEDILINHPKMDCTRHPLLDDLPTCSESSRFWITTTFG